MRKYFADYLNEKITDTEEIIYLIKKDCKPFLKDWQTKYNKKFLFSARKNKTVDFAKNRVRKDRVPRDTPVEAHNWLDNYFKKKFGIKFRSNSLFCSFDRDTISTYGMLYYIFPIGNYKMLSSSLIVDAYSSLDDIGFWITTKDFGIENYWYDLDNETKDKIFDEFKDEIENANYKLNQWVRDSEQMLNCKEYYMVRFRYDFNEKKFKGLLENA